MAIMAEDINQEPGYKQTEAGIVPEDWDVKSIGDSFDICNHLRYPISQEVRKKMVGVYPYYGPTKIQDYINVYRVEGEYALIGEDGDHFLKWQESPMTLLITGKFNVNNHAHLVKGTKNLTSWFYYYFQNKDLTLYLTRQGAGRYKLTKATLIAIPCALPPFPEQTAIATALSDVDALITSLDKLIAKKRDIKQATMLQLLTGKTRLPGFNIGPKQSYKRTEAGIIPDDWEIKKLGDIAEFLDGRRRPIKEHNRAKMRGEYPYYGASGIVDYVNDYLFDEELILLGEDGENILSRSCRLAFRVSGKIWVNNHAHVIRPKVDTNIGFLSEYLEILHYEQHNTGTAQPKLNKKVCSEITVFSPSLIEQTAIATVLSDMDAEIVALEQRCDKTRMLKQGMMQELLTGKTRLVP